MEMPSYRNLILLFRILASFCDVAIHIDKNYNKDIMPFNEDQRSTSEALNVSLQIYINNMIPVIKRDMHYFIDLFIRQYWRDDRLTFTKLKIEKEKSEAVTLNEKFYGRIWKPDTFFPYSKEAKSHKTTLPNRMFILKRQGSIFYSHRVSMQVYCKMILTNFPFDVQKCTLPISSYGHSDKLIRLFWNYAEGGPLYRAPKLQMLEFTLTDIQYYKTNVQLFQGNRFDRLVIEFTFERNYVYYILLMYLPAILIVMVSWVGFWIDYRSTPARVSIGITTVLTIGTLVYSVQTSIPQSNYLKSIDVYNITCLCFVFVTVIEFAFILTIENEWRVNKKKKDDEIRNKFLEENKEKRYKNIGNHRETKIEISTDQLNSMVPNQEQLNKLQNLHKRRQKKYKLRIGSKSSILDQQMKYRETHLVDRIMRKFLPFVFFVFNAFYFYWSLRKH